MTRPKHIDWTLLIVLLIAGLTRLSSLNLIEFKADEALTVLSLEQFIQKPHLIKSGLVSSTGARNFPLFQYLLVPASYISSDPRFLSGFIASINVLMIAWFYLVTKREFGQKTAAVAALILATSPYNILFSRKIWAQDLIILFAVPIYDLLFRLKHNPSNQKSLLILIILLTLQSQLHASGIFFFLLIILYLLIKPTKSPKTIIIGLLLGVIPAIPYFYLQFSSIPQFPDLQAYQQTSLLLANRPNITHLITPFTYLTSFSWQEIMGDFDFNQFSQKSPAVAIDTLTSFILIISLVFGIYKTFSQKQHRLSSYFILGFIGLYILFTVPARLHYYQLISPYVALLAALGLQSLFKSQPLFLYPTLSYIVLSRFIFIGLFFSYLSTNQGVLGDYGVPYSSSVIMVNQVIAPYRQRPDYLTIKALAHFNPVSAKLTQGQSIVDMLDQYFKTIE